MSELLPIIRRVRRPLVPEEVEYCSCCGKQVAPAPERGAAAVDETKNVNSTERKEQSHDPKTANA